MIGPDGVLEQVKAVNPVLVGDPPAFDEIRTRIGPTESAIPAHSRRRRPRPLDGLRAPLLALPVLLLIAAGALAAGGVIGLGAPAEPSGGLVNPHTQFGALSTGTVRLLPISAPDPHGGPPWGMRIYSTSQDIGCIQVGRLLYGKLGAIGRDGAFNDDGLFHAVPLSGEYHRGCTVLDGDGRIFLNVTATNIPASGFVGLADSCVPASTPPQERPAAMDWKTCPQTDERNLYYGLLGPDAKSITYTLGGQRHTQATVGPEGGYLIVTEASPHQLFDGPNGGTTDVVPVDGPITELHYRNGMTCPPSPLAAGSVAKTPAPPNSKDSQSVGIRRKRRH